MSEYLPLEHEVIIAQCVEDRQKCFDIRLQVFHKEQKFPADTEIDEYDAGAKTTHFLLHLIPSRTPIGTIRCIKLAPFTYKLTRLAVLKDHRKQNFGRRLVLALHDWVQQQAQLELIDNNEHGIISPPINSANESEHVSANGSCIAHVNIDDQGPSTRLSSSGIHNTSPTVKIVAHSQIPVERFYARFGYQPEGDIFDEEGEPHQKMIFQLPLRQVLHV